MAEQIEDTLRHGPIDLACLFLSSHYAEHAEELSSVVFDRLSPRALLGCTGEGIIASSEEIESAPAVTLWAAHLPGTALVPYFERLPENLHEAFMAQYRERLRAVFPNAPVFYPFRRILFAATRSS